MSNHVCNVCKFILRDEFTAGVFVVVFLNQKTEIFNWQQNVKLQGTVIQRTEALNVQQHLTGSLNTALLEDSSISHQLVNEGKMHALQWAIPCFPCSYENKGIFTFNSHFPFCYLSKSSLKKQPHKTRQLKIKCMWKCKSLLSLSTVLSSLHLWLAWAYHEHLNTERTNQLFKLSESSMHRFSVMLSGTWRTLFCTLEKKFTSLHMEIF